MAVAHRQRSAWEVTWSVWRAMFIREALQRTMADRFSWFWMLVQPMAQVLVFIGVREMMGRIDMIAGADYIPWLVVGMMVFMLFSEGLVRSLGAIDANRGLLSYRQVQPIDGVLVRITIEGFLKAVVFLFLIVGFQYVGITLVPVDPLAIVLVWLLAWFFGLAAGVFFSVLTCLIPSLTTVVRISMMPLYFLSGVMIPVNYLPHSIQTVLAYNPALHLVEIMRSVWFSGYHPVPGMKVEYVLLWSVSLLFLGLLLYLHYKERLVAA